MSEAIRFITPDDIFTPAIKLGWDKSQVEKELIEEFGGSTIGMAKELEAIAIMYLLDHEIELDVANSPAIHDTRYQSIKRRISINRSTN